MKNFKNIDELFREKLQNYEQAPPDYLLENILAAATGNNRRRKLILWRIAGVAAALLLAFVAGWQFNTRDGVVLKQPMVISQNAAPKAESEKIIQAEAKMTIKQTESSIPLVAPSSQTEKVKNKEFAESSKSIKYVSVAEPDQQASNNESLLLKPLHYLYSLIPNDKGPVQKLQERKTKEAADEWIEKSIDQQIMEQNKQAMLAQNSDKEKGRWLVGAQVSPAYSVSRSSHSKQYASNMLNSQSTNPVDLGGGLSVEYKPGKRWSLQSGVYYSGMEQSSGSSTYSNAKNSFAPNVGSDYLSTNLIVDATTNKISMNSTAGVIEFKGIPSGIALEANLDNKSVAGAIVASDATFVQNFEYLEIPLYLRYTLIDSRFDVEMLGGFSSNLLVGNQTFMESNTGKSLVGKTQDMQTMNYSGTLGVGLKYGLSKRLYLNVEPRVKYYLNSLNSNSSVSYKPYTIGVFTGLSYEF